MSSQTGAITMTHLQSQTEFSFWALFNSPLIVTTDIRDMSNKADILLNREVIAVNQDPVHFFLILLNCCMI
jgi:alpha-galactosidase